MSNEQTPEHCWFCHDDVRVDKPAGGWLYDDGTWRIGHAPASYAIAGTLIMEARRHVADQATMNDTEQASLARVTGMAIAAMREVLGCDRVYQWSTMAAYLHYHVWLLPWWKTSAEHGPAYLQATIETGCPPEKAEQTAAGLRAVIARNAQLTEV